MGLWVSIALGRCNAHHRPPRRLQQRWRGGAIVVVGCLLACSGIIHRPVRVHLLPHIIVRPRCVIVHPIFVKSTSHPALHSVTTLMRECDAKPGMMWARRAAAGRPGRSNVPVCVDCTLSPLGRRATIGFCVGWMLVTCAPVVRKLLVAPESKMAHLLMVSMSMLTVRRSVAAARA